VKSIQADVIDVHNPHPTVNEGWLALRQEDVLDPQIPVIDAHLHLWDRPNNRYLLDELRKDLDCGHEVKATVFIECGSMYRATGPRELKPVGETEFVTGIAAMFGSGKYGPTRVCAGIVGFADLLLGDKVQPVLEAHIAAAGGRFRGIRNVACWYKDPAFVRDITFYQAPEGMLLDDTFQRGFRQLAPLKLSFETFVFHTQLGEVEALAQKFPETTIIVNHIGGPIKIGPYQGREEEVFADWHKGIKKLAAHPNVYMKIGGLTTRTSGLNFKNEKVPPSSADLAAPWQAYFDAALAAFGANRCIFESNFPVEKPSCSARVSWNSLKLLAAGCSESEKRALCYGSSTEAYRLGQ